jgi:predicted transcriptional regulator
MHRTRQLTDLQTAVMQVLWRQGEATVVQVHAALQEKRRLATTTVATLLSRLEKYGFLTHRAEGRQYIYRPLVSQSEVRQSQVAGLIEQLFQGNPADLMCHLINESEVESEDLARIAALIESKGSEDGDSNR